MNGDDDCSERDDGNVVVVKVYCNDDDGAWYWCPPKNAIAMFQNLYS